MGCLVIVTGFFKGQHSAAPFYAPGCFTGTLPPNQGAALVALALQRAHRNPAKGAGP